MTVLSINGINAGAFLAVSQEPKGGRRDIGNEGQGSDGSMRITRQTRKRDLSALSVPLSVTDANVWESLIIGEGDVWSFDTSLYSSKGLGPSAMVGGVNTTQQTASSKFGTGRLQVADTSGSISYPAAINLFGNTANWTVCVWRSIDGAFSWQHYVVRSDGAKWADGVRDDATSTTWLSVSSGVVTITNTLFFTNLYDDLIVLPFKVLDAWPPQIYARATAYPPTPYLDLTGDMITEQTTRRVLGSASDTIMKTSASTMKAKLAVEFKAK